MKHHPEIYSLVAAGLLILPAALHSTPPSLAGSPENAERVTLSSTPLVAPGWKEVTLITPKADASNTRLSLEKDLPPEFSTGPAMTRPLGGSDITFSPPPEPVQRSSRRKDGLLSPDRSERAADSPPNGLAPMETSGWLAEGMRDLDTSRQRRETTVSPRKSRDSMSPWRLQDTDRGLDRSISPDAGYDMQGDAFAPVSADVPSHSTRRR